MAYRLVQSEEGTNLLSVESIDDDVMSLPVTTTTSEHATPYCSEKVLANLHKFVQHGVKTFEMQDRDDEDSVSSDDTICAMESTGAESFDLESFLSSLSNQMTQAVILLEKEGLVDPLEWASELSKRCQSFTNGGVEVNVSVIKTFLGDIAKLLHKVRPVDVELLLELLQAGRDAGDTMEGKDVLLLIGQTGCGKTSTIHYLAGSTFKGVVVNGSDHLEITNVAHPDLIKAKTSSSTRSVTKSVLSIDITTGGGDIVAIADTPGFDDTDGVETDIANGYGMVTAIGRAKRVKPVLILSEKGIGDRFKAVSQILGTITRLFTNVEDTGEKYPTPFAYAFTKYDPKYTDRLHEVFRAKMKELTDAEREDRKFSSFVRDIKNKTKPTANVVLPLDEGNRLTLLSALMEGEWCENPSASFSIYVSESSLNMLTVQLQLTCTSIRRALDRIDSHFVLTKIIQLVELGNHLPVVASCVRQGLDDVSDFLTRYEQSLTSCIEKCKGLRTHGEAFKRELGTAKEIIEILVAFHPVSNKLSSFQQSNSTPPKGVDFCVRSVTDLTNVLEENVWSQRGSANFVSRLRQQKEEAIKDLIRLKEVADVFTPLTHTVTRAALLYQECIDDLIAGIITILEGTYKLVSNAWSQKSFMPESFLLALKADFDVFSIVGNLKARGVALGDHSFNELWHKAGDVFVLNLQNKIAAVVEELSSTDPDQDIETMVGIDRQSITDVNRVLLFLVDHPDLSACLNRMDSDVAAKALKDVESSIASFIPCLVDKVEVEFNDAKKVDDEARIQDIKQYLADIDGVCAFCQNVSPTCESQGKRIAVIASRVEDHIKSLSAKHRAMLEQAEHYLREIKTQDPTYVLAMIAAAWDEWEEALVTQAQVPKKKSGGGIMTRIFSAIGLVDSNSSSSSKESDFTLRLKSIMRDIEQRLWSRMERSYQVLNSPSSILLLVNVVAIEDSALIASIIKPSNAGARTRRVHLYTSAQVKLSEFLKSFTVNIKMEDCVTVNNTLNKMKEEAKSWQEIKESVKRMNPKTNTQHELCDKIQAFKDYPSQCQSLLTQIKLIKSEFMKISFLDDKRADSINEYDRNVLYREVTSTLSLLEGIQVLQSHLSVEVDVMWIESVDHIESQIESINEYLAKIMTTFPSIEVDFRKLNIWRSNLYSIEGCFRGVEPKKLSGRARRFRDEIDRGMALVLKRIEPPAAQKLVSLLLLLKKASNDISCWRNDINKAIDGLLLAMSISAPNGGRFIFGVKLELKSVKGGTDEVVALQILSEHKCFEGAMNAVFNSATARQGIEYVIESIGLAGESKDALRSMYSTFQEQYKILIERGLLATKSDSMPAYLQELANEAKAVAMDYSVDYRTQITRLTTLIFAYWSLKSMNSFVTGAMSKDEGTNNAAMEYLMKPHAAQVVSIWCLLNFEHDEYQILKNHFIEILTGEGKSITLGVTGIILAMLDCNVVCVCYSAYLSSRDYTAFVGMFNAFGVKNSIKYSTIRDACEELLYNKGGDTRSLSRDIAWGTKTYRGESDDTVEKVQVLIVDEADVILDKNFHGDCFRSVVSLRHASIRNLLKHIWENRDTLHEASFAVSPIARTCINLFPGDMQPIISKLINSMLGYARGIGSHSYIVWDGEICYKEMDGICSSTLVYGYSTAFAGIKEYEKGSITKEVMEQGLAIHLNCGQSSYAEMPNIFDVILGVSGTLSSLDQNEKEILSQYGINKFTSIPSVFGDKRLAFACDNPHDVMIADDDANFHLDLRNEINARRKPEKEGCPSRAVMLFFECRKEAESFYESEQMVDLKSHTRVLTEEISPKDKEGAFLQSTRSGAITLMIREYGRGTDFVCYDNRMLDGGGVHVIQAFFSTEISEEIQIKGRTARQGARGSYSMVLHKKSLLTNLELDPSDIESMCRQSKIYSHLESKRSQQYAETLSQRKAAVEKAEKLHYETIDYKQCALNDKRKETIVYLEKWNGLTSVTPDRVDTKTFLLAEKLERIAKHQKFERSKRSEAKSKKVEKGIEEDEFFDASDNLEEDAPTMNEDGTYYGVLGVPPNATLSEIAQAYRQESLKWHPDRNDDPTARKCFHKLTEARDVLSDPESRQVYDEGLRSGN